MIGDRYTVVREGRGGKFQSSVSVSADLLREFISTQVLTGRCKCPTCGEMTQAYGADTGDGKIVDAIKGVEVPCHECGSMVFVPLRRLSRREVDELMRSGDPFKEVRR